MDAKEIFDHFLNAASAIVGNEDPPPRGRAREPLSAIPKLKQFGAAGPSCCIAKRPVGAGKLPEVRKPDGE